MEQRICSHKVETRSRDWLRSIIDMNEDALFREISERDYGVDALIELFEKGKITGKTAFIQIKGTGTTIVPLKNEPVVSCTVTSSSVYYAFQNRIPFIIAYVSIKKPEVCYWGLLQEIITKDITDALSTQKTVTVHIPQAQYFKQNAEQLLEAIRTFYNIKDNGICL